MAEFCYKCLKEIHKTDKSIKEYIISRELNLCEECGEWKHTVVMERKAYSRYILGIFIFPFKIICKKIFK